uniref:Uncharacterized protein n=1 Tax=Romanomermis culicivorax TaxID=13658 RepID=A0A915J5J1_ROMCU
MSVKVDCPMGGRVVKTKPALDFMKKTQWREVVSKLNLSFPQVVAEIVGYPNIDEIPNTGQHCQGDKGIKDQLNPSTQNRL